MQTIENTATFMHDPEAPKLLNMHLPHNAVMHAHTTSIYPSSQHQ